MENRVLYFQKVLIYEKEREPPNIFHNRAKSFTFLREFDHKNTFFFQISRNLIRKGCFQMTVNARQSPADSL